MILLTDSEKSEITQAIKETEKHTYCEIVVMEVSHCDDYNTSRFIWSIICASLTAYASYLLYRGNIAYFVLAQMLGFLVGLEIISRIPFLRRLFVSGHKMRREAHTRAMAEFHHQHINRAHGRKGILIMLAVFERTVVILSNRTIHHKIPQGYWEAMKDKIIDGIKQRKSGKAVCETIRSCAEELKKHFPARIGDTDELSDEVVTEL